MYQAETVMPAPTPSAYPFGAQKLPPLPPEAQSWFKTLSPELFANYQQVETTWNHPATQFTASLVLDPGFRQAATEISQKYQSSSFLGYEFVWILLIWVIRAWRLSKSNTWLIRIWTQAWIAVVFWWGSLFLIPLLLWGKSYQTVLGTIIRSFMHQFLA